MQGQQRRGGPRPPAAAEPKAPAGRRDLDINRERLIYCLTSLVGHKATAKCRNNVVYEGIFHSCALDSDYSITLTSARLVPPKGDKSGEVIRTLVIPGKDFLQISASDVPPPAMLSQAMDHKRFATDGEIAKTRRHGQAERELVSWQPEGDESQEVSGALGSGSMAGWDHFALNEQMYGISSSFNEELYTTKLDPSSMSREQRERAERIAAEIERGRNHSEAEGVLDGDYNDDEEELRFSAVVGAGSKWRKDGISGGGASSSSGKGRGRSASAANLVEPLTEERLNQHEALSGAAGDSFAREHRAKRGMITDHRHVGHVAHSPMRSPMISEMKRINALNLEPALPKLDDKTRTDWINFKQAQGGPNPDSSQRRALMSSLQESLKVIKSRQATKDGHSAAAAAAAMPVSEGADGDWQHPSASSGHKSGDSASGVAAPATMASPSGGGSKPFTFNAAAKEFSFNPGAASFTPTNAAGGASGSNSNKALPSQQSQISSGFCVLRKPYPEMLDRSLSSLLDNLLKRSVGERPEEERHTIWPHATGASFKEVLGQPIVQPGVPMPTAMPTGGPGRGSWQPQGGMGGPGTPGGGMQMMAGGFMMPGGGSGGQQPANMQFTQMYPGPRTPQGGQGMGMHGGKGPSQSPKHGPPQGQAFMVPQGMNPQGMMTTGGMQGGTAMTGMPKFGQMVPVMMPSGQFASQGFMGGQGQMVMMQGQMGQTIQPQAGFANSNVPGRGPT